MHEKLKRHWWVLPVLSGTLLILTFHPFNIWPLGFVALAPLFYFVAGFARSRKQVFLGGFVAGGMFSFSLSYFTLIQFHWLPETYLFVDAVHLAVFPITLIGGSICGLSLLMYRRLRGPYAALNMALAAAAYALAELLLQLIFGGYYLATLAYAATQITPLLSIAAIGGAPLVSLCLAWINGIIAESLTVARARDLTQPLAISVGVFALCFVPNYIYLHWPIETSRTLSISLVQAGDGITGIFGTQQKGAFTWPMAHMLARAASSSPDLLIYPFSPVEGALYRGTPPVLNKSVLVASESSIGAFEARVVGASTTLLTWNNLYHDGKFYNEFELWRDGAVVSEYEKRALFPFMDYTPAWAARFGLYSTPFDEVPGISDNGLNLKGQALGDLMCSELHNASLARQEAKRAPIIIAVGSEAMFLDSVASEFSLRAAQLRAAENDVPVVRGNILGPSGMTDRFGALTAKAPAGKSAILVGNVVLTPSRPTLYSLLGDWLVWGLVALLLGASWLSVRKRA